MENIIIAGSREFTDYNLLKNTLKNYIKDNEETTIICGGANGADTLGERFAKENNIKIDYYIPEWGKWGKMAGHFRNSEMAKVGNTLFAFWNGKSRGTQDMIKLAEKHKLNIKIIEY